MNKNIDCEIIRDLLPSYADGVSSINTNRAVEEHIADCPSCAEALRLMKEPETDKEEPKAEVDYLKKVRRRTSKVGLLCGIIMMIVGMSAIFTRVFFIGSEAKATDANFTVSVSGNTVYVDGNLSSSSMGVARVELEESAGIVNVKLYTAPKTFFNRGSISKQYTAHNDTVGMVRCGDLILWENGVRINAITSKLYAAINPFVGDMPSNSEIADILDIYGQFGASTGELQTASEPYGWILKLEAQISSDDEHAALDVMTADSYVMLATVSNLGYVTWEYDTQAGRKQYTVSAEDAAAYTGKDIKTYAESASELQSLIESLSLKWAGVKDTLQESGTFYLKIRNYSDAEIYGLTVNYYLGGKLIGSKAVENADKSALKKKDELIFDFVPSDFPDGTKAEELSAFTFDLYATDKDGNKILIRDSVSLYAKYAWTFDFSLTGNYTNGFILNEG